MTAINETRLREILTGSPTVAVLGINDDREKAASYVPDYLYNEGYRIIGVNPKLAGTRLFDQIVRKTLREIDEAIDLVDVFRRPDQIPMHVDDILAMTPRPAVVWFQLGITNDEAARVLEAAGIVVVQDRCTLADHRRLGLGRPERR